MQKSILLIEENIHILFNVYFLSAVGDDCTTGDTNWACCNNKPGKCGEGEGDCDYDSHCKAGLKCGVNNCPSGFPSSGYDCCYKGICIYSIR